MFAYRRPCRASMLLAWALLLGCSSQDDDAASSGGTGAHGEGGACVGDQCVCQPGDDCDVVCGDGDCRVHCQADTQCQVSCNAATPCLVDCIESNACEVDCGQSEDCRVTCPSTGCVIRNCNFGSGCLATCGPAADAVLPTQSGSDWVCD